MSTTIAIPPGEDSPLSPLEAELLKSVADLELRLSRLEGSLKADSATAQAQRQSIADKVEALNRRLASVEQLLPALRSLADSLVEFQQQCADLHELFGAHATNYNRAVEAFGMMQKAWREQLAAYQLLHSQVAHLTAELRSLGA